MNENSSTNTSTAHHGLTAEAISRRAYELWEQEGRPESRDLHHWLRAEQELLAEQSKSSASAGDTATATNAPVPAPAAPTRTASANTDTHPLQGTRAAAAASRDTKSAAKRGTPNPFPTETAGGRFVKNGRSGGK